LRTSETHPLYVDFIPLEDWNITGKVALTFAPGKCHPSPKGDWNRDLEKDLDRLKNYWKIDVLVSLIEKHEFHNLQIPNLFDSAKRKGIRVIWFPIQDQSIPLSVTAFHRIVTEINDLIENGKIVAIHCMAGQGRTGLMVASCLVSLLNICPEEAIKLTRKVRGEAIQTASQEKYISFYYKYLAKQQNE
jgi:protein-tyrosine phosphatase